jgi:hypothetical protein
MTDKKITLITPPDFYENGNLSILFINLSEKDQDTISKWFATTKLKEDLNFYVYNGEPALPWFFYAMSRCDYKYIDCDVATFVTDTLASYLLSKPNVYYKTSDKNLDSVYSHINTNKIEHIETFMENVFGGQAD